MDPEVGKVLFAPNLDWKDVPLKKDLEKQLEVPVWQVGPCGSAWISKVSASQSMRIDFSTST